MNSADDFSRLELSLPAATRNYRYFRSLLEQETKMLVLVKANAYGHGAVEFASLMQQAGADYLAVALPVEGIELRRAGISLPILVLTSGTDFFQEMIEYRLEPSIPNLETLKALVAVLDERGVKGFPIHIKLDTGMHRLGFMTSELPALFEYLKSCPAVRVKSTFSHLAVAEDPEQDEFTLSQIEMFRENATELGEALGYKPMWHILNSAGIERFPQFQFDMVRLGIGIYGISALPSVHLAPVASLKVKILQIKELKASDGIRHKDRHHPLRLCRRPRQAPRPRERILQRQRAPRPHHREHLHGHVHAGRHRHPLRCRRHSHHLRRRPHNHRTSRAARHHPLRDPHLRPPKNRESGR